MQRVAYLLYRYRNTLQADNILLFSPNPMFNSYVATVLPELGEDNMQQSTFYQYLQHRIKNLDVESPYNQLEYMLGSKRDHTYFIRKKSILLKSSLPYQSYIDQFAKTLLSEGMLFKNIKFRGDLFISKEEIADYFYRLTHIQTIPNRLVHVKNWLQERLDEKEKSEKTSEWVEMERELLEREEYLKVYKKLQRERRFTENTFDDFEREERLIADWIVKRKLKPLRKKINAYAFLDTVGIYRVFLHWLLTNENIQMPEEWKEICELTIANLSKRQIFYEDATPYLYLKDKLEGKHVHTSIRHVFIDEAQDYSPFQLAYLKQIFPNSKMTILGDMNQSIFVHSISHQHAFSQSSELFPEHELETIVLTKVIVQQNKLLSLRNKC